MADLKVGLIKSQGIELENLPQFNFGIKMRNEKLTDIYQSVKSECSRRSGLQERSRMRPLPVLGFSRQRNGRNFAVGVASAARI